jgi:hypothetical protein
MEDVNGILLYCNSISAEIYLVWERLADELI